MQRVSRALLHMPRPVLAARRRMCRHCRQACPLAPPTARLAVGQGTGTCPHLLRPGPPVHAGQQIRLKGKNMTENEHVKLGAYHTLELELQRAFSLHKVRWCRRHGCMECQCWHCRHGGARGAASWGASWRPAAGSRQPLCAQLPPARPCSAHGQALAVPAPNSVRRRPVAAAAGGCAARPRPASLEVPPAALLPY